MTPKLRWPALINSKLLPSLPGYAESNRTIYKTPVGEMLQAFAIDLSGSREYVVVHCFVQRLYVPGKTEMLNFGYRMRDPRAKSEAWELADLDAALYHMANEMQRERVQFLDHVRTPGEFVAYAVRTWGAVRTAHQLEGLGSSLVRIGAYREAAKALAEAQVGLNLSVNRQREQHEQLQQMLRYLSDGAFEDAQAQLDSWRRGTIAAIGIS